MSLEEILIQLKGKTISEVLDHCDKGADSGLTIKFTDGTKLSFGYSGCEGFTTFNGNRIKELD